MNAIASPLDRRSRLALAGIALPRPAARAEQDPAPLLDRRAAAGLPLQVAGALQGGGRQGRAEPVRDPAASGIEPVPPGHRGAGDPARQSRNEHDDDLRGRAADRRMGLLQSRLPVPRLGPRHQGDERPDRRALPEGRRREDGHRHPGADLSRHAPAQPAHQARREGAGRSRRASSCAWPRGPEWLLLGESLGVTPTPMAMPEVYLVAQDRLDRRPGEPAHHHERRQVLRGDRAGGADRASGAAGVLCAAQGDLGRALAPSRRRSCRTRPSAATAQNTDAAARRREAGGRPAQDARARRSPRST